MTAPLPGPYPEERRLATVLFADIQGFTPLADRLDFETVSDLIKEVWLRLDSVIEAHQGYIDKHIGDAVMAVWGAPHAGEDDAVHAVTAALAMQASLAEYVELSPREGSRELKMRVGLHTGPVLAGYVGVRGEYTMMGDTVNVASRLEQAAEAGTVVISESTYRLVRGAFRVRRLPPLPLKGKPGLIQAFLVKSAREQPGRVRYRDAGGLETHMVGREAELARLEALYRQACQSEAPVLALVTGEAGLGKSRLLMEFTSRLEADEPALTMMSARALAETARVPYFLWKSLWHNRFGVSDDDPPHTAREKVVRGVQALWGRRLGPASAVEAAHLIGALTSPHRLESPYLAAFEDAPDARVKRTYAIIRELLERACTAGPAVLLLDDLQWADPGSLDLLAYLLQPASAPLPLFILGGARPELLRQHASLATSTEVIALRPLPARADVVAAAYPELRSLPEEALAELARRAEGNPYFLEEMVKSLVHTGLMHAGHTGPEIVASLRELLPASLQSLLQARLDGLSPEARGVALLASVVGRVFWMGAVMAATRLASGTGILTVPSNGVESLVREALAQLVQGEMAFPRVGSAFVGEQEYIFKHSLLRDVAYSLLPHKYRRMYHQAVAGWLAARAGSDFAVVVANHYERAEAIAQAAWAYEQAAHHARLQGADDEARALESRAQALKNSLTP